MISEKPFSSTVRKGDYTMDDSTGKIEYLISGALLGLLSMVLFFYLGELTADFFSFAGFTLKITVGVYLVARLLGGKYPEHFAIGQGLSLSLVTLGISSGLWLLTPLSSSKFLPLALLLFVLICGTPWLANIITYLGRILLWRRESKV